MMERRSEDDTGKKIDRLLREIRSIGDYYPLGLPPDEPYRCEILPPVPWDQQLLEKDLRVTIPFDLRYLWRKASSIHLFEDITAGQWGLVIYSPNALRDIHKDKEKYWGSELIYGDLIVGTFRGDPDLLIIRCDLNKSDFGSVVVAKAISHRDGWYKAAKSFSGFLERYLDVRGDWFWE